MQFSGFVEIGGVKKYNMSKATLCSVEIGTNKASKEINH